MKIGKFDNHMMSFLHDSSAQAKEDGIDIIDIFDLSYVGTKDEDDGNPFDIDVLLVNPTLNKLQWKNLLECVQKNPQVKFIFFLTNESNKDFQKDNFDRFPNVESYIDRDEKFNRLSQLLQEAIAS